MKPYILGVFNAAVLAAAMLCAAAVAQENVPNVQDHSEIPLGLKTAYVVALISLVGAIFAPFYTQCRQSKREKYRELRSKLSEVMYEVAGIRHWAFQQQTYHDLLQIPDSRQKLIEKAAELRNPGEKIWAITFGYLPEYTHASALTLVNAIWDYQKEAAKLGIAHHEDDASAQKQAMESLLKQQIAVQTAQKEFAKVTRKLMDDYLHEKSSGERKICRWLKKFC